MIVMLKPFEIINFITLDHFDRRDEWEEQLLQKEAELQKKEEELRLKEEELLEKMRFA